MANGDEDGVVHDLFSLLSSEDRNFLVRNNADQVEISSLSGKIVGLYFSGSWCGPCRRFTPSLVEVYQDLASKGDFEVVFISSDRDDKSFSGYFSEMPWLAIPFSDLEARKRLKELFKVRGIPNLVIIVANGKVSTDQGTRVVMEHGVDGYPFTAEKINFLKEQEAAAKENQSLSSLLVSRSRDYLISKDGSKVPVSELEGKMVGLYFSLHTHKPCKDFTQALLKFHEKLKEKGENFEIVLISLDYEEEHFKQGFQAPWLALPFKAKSCEKLARHFELENVPTLVIIGQDGKTLRPNAVELIEEYGIEAYPFSAEKIAELADISKAKLEEQTLESLLVAGDRNFVIEKTGSKVPVSELAGKHIMLYFSAHWCPPCRAFMPKLIKAYNQIKAKDSAFEIIFISSDRDHSSFKEFFSTMPWLALPLGDPRKALVQRKFRIQGIPALVAISPNGQTLSTQARQLIQAYGADAYPFTEEHLKHLEEKLEEEAKGWPEKVKSELHAEHELTRVLHHEYVCWCREPGSGWSFYCKECDFHLHPRCALSNKEGTKADAPNAMEGYICDGDVCRKV
ncbi:PREDICTED: probable nucleoredoxin [Prunus dulcis]|uniref:protein-disulfide reductase n=1 Tax=Prunus dulcis TaxID=3755 RepID=A0A5E4ED84_PRUDU|nr:probable nucleoredoxin 1 [Prunus dulcis]VVA13406.1 PREDICTED: probable nucleoredoxin [Prunus dulcis]